MRILKNLIRVLQSAKTARPARQAPRRANLLLECLEDRMVLSTASPVASALPMAPSTASHVASILPTAPSTPVRFATPSGYSASQSGSALTINVAGGETTLTLSSNGAGLIELSDSSQSDFAQFSIASINAVFINLGQPQNGYPGDTVDIDDSHGLAFAFGTSVALQGNVGGGATLNLCGSGVVRGDETFVDADANGNESLSLGVVNSLGGVHFSFNKAAIGEVLDAMQIGGAYSIQTSSPDVQLSSDGSFQVLYDLGVPAVFYANKGTIVLNEFAPNAGILLTSSSASIAPSQEGIFIVEMHGAGDVTTIGYMPSYVVTMVFANLGTVANNATVHVGGNSGPVAINGNSSTNVSFSAEGTQANVSVSNVASLSMNDKGESPTSVTVTQNSISGVGLFGNNSVKLSYFNVGTLNLEADGAFEKYTVRASQPGAAVIGNGQQKKVGR